VNIGYDIHSLFADYYKNREVGEYCTNLINEIESNGQEQVFKFNCYNNTTGKNIDKNTRDYFIKKDIIDDFLYLDDLFVRITAAQVQHFCCENKLDVMHFISPFNYEAASLLKLPQNMAKVVTVYDFLPAIFPEHYLNDSAFKHHYMRQRELLLCFDAIIAVSATTAQDLMDYTEISKEKIFIVDLGFEPAYTELTHPVEKIKLFNLGAAIADTVSRQVVAEKTLEVYKEVIRRKKESVKLSVSQRGKKRIAWFSPLPPSSSGIAGYSYEILMLLEKRMDIDIFIDKGYTPDVPGLTVSKIYPHTLFEEMNENTGYDAVIYQMGSSPFHTYMMGYIKKYNGIVVSHDTNYHPVLYHHVEGVISCPQYREALRIEFGQENGDTIFEDINNSSAHHHQIQQQYPMSNYFLGDTKKLVTTTEFNRLKALECEIGRDVSVIHLHSWVPGDYYDMDTSGIREKLGIPAGSTVIGSFGSLNHFKRNLESLMAFDIVASEYDNVYFHLVGGPDKEYYDELLSFVKRNRRLRNRVVFTGAVTNEEYFERMKITDIFIGLRSDTNSNSAPLLRALGAGLPCIISRIGVFDYIDDDSVIKVDINDDEINGIASAIKNLLLNKTIRKEYSQKAKNLSDTLFSAVAAVDKYEKVINEFDGIRRKIILTNKDIDNMVEYFRNRFDPGSGDLLHEWISAASKEVSVLNQINDG